MRVVVLGAAGQLGREVVRALVARGHTVRAAVRRAPEPPLASSVEIRIADARNKSETRAAICGFDAVVNVIGGGTLRRNDVASSTSAVAVPAAQEAGAKAVHRHVRRNGRAGLAVVHVRVAAAYFPSHLGGASPRRRYRKG